VVAEEWTTGINAIATSSGVFPSKRKQALTVKKALIRVAVRECP
jgi:hypothetical protein